MNILLIQGSSSSSFPLLCIGFFLTVIIITVPLSASNDTMYPEQSLSETIDRNGTSEFFLEWNQSEKYWRSGLWTGHYFAAVPILPEMKTHTIVTISYVDNKERRYTTCTYRDPSKITRQIMDVNGQIKQLVWMDDAQDWVLFFSRPSSQCDVYSICGPFGVCDQKSLPVCSCAHGFSPASLSDWELNDWSSGCARNTKLECGNSISTTKEKDGFLVMPNMMLPTNPTFLEAYKLEKDCRSACLNDCSCNAYAHNGSGCLTWNKEPRNLQQLHERDGTAQTLYVRLAASDLPRSKHNHKILITVISVVTVIGILAILVVLLNIFLRFRQRRFISSAQAMEGSCVRFTYAELQHITKDFSEKLGGGGFGSVFKGTLPDSIAIAVKKHEGVRQGEKQFRAEVRTLCTIQHINLIRLRGFCSEGDKKLLVYEFMQNGSLDSILFGSRKILSWKTRYEIITGIARGLAYLHEKCMERIIHCDIKPENILLDENFYPKVADFGMAKLIGRDISREVLALLDDRLEGDAVMEELVTASRVASWCIQDDEAHRPSMGQVVQILDGVVEVNVAPVPRSNVIFPIRIASQLILLSVSCTSIDRVSRLHECSGGVKVSSIVCACTKNQQFMASIASMAKGGIDLRSLLLHMSDECCCMRQLKRIHACLLRHHILSPLILAKLLLFTALSPKGSLRYATLIFSHNCRNISSSTASFFYNTLMRGYADTSCPFLSLSIFISMRRCSVPPDHFTFTFLLKAQARSSSSSKYDAAIHAQVLKFGCLGSRLSHHHVHNALIHLYASRAVVDSARQLLEEMPLPPDAVSWSGLLTAHLRAGDPDAARAVFDRSIPAEQRDVVSWTAIISGYTRSGRPRDALHLFDAMPMLPDEVTMVGVVTACAALGDLKTGERLHRYVEARGLDWMVALRNALIDMYAKCGCLPLARMVFDGMGVYRTRTVVTWNSMIWAHSAHGDAEGAIALFRRLSSGEDPRLRPDKVSNLAVLSACAHAGRVDEGRKLFDEMTEASGVEVGVEHYGCMVDMLGRAGILEEAWLLIESMPIPSNDAVWGALLAGCRIHGDVEMGKKAVKKLVELKPHEGGYYILLSAIYVAAGRPGEAALIRRHMTRSKATKTTGLSRGCS
ncbi:G-type lectin S-receptor-like serine/threonine-protein kinase [Apostasia shenzhenica]|uniref:non-specific serine/threonine protein kinase n=1 Tax=Apostasia shenzhenica TaxID=1088818 RepID=A0A2H9ZQW2_9ASPA|nr:G-type lectin S-receptor-like serine/threonine-protein kinase [Apostasia shenzhenica]